jgi:hypothetical protein
MALLKRFCHCKPEIRAGDASAHAPRIGDARCAKPAAKRRARVCRSAHFAIFNDGIFPPRSSIVGRKREINNKAA